MHEYENFKKTEKMSTVTGNKVNRGERILNAMASEGLISESGKCWLECALDPFHDHQLKRLDGWPDVQTGASVVRNVKQSVTITKPALAAAGLWDLHIVQWPWLTANQGASSVGNYTADLNRSGQFIKMNVSTASGAKCGGLQAYYVQPGTPLQITLPASATTLLAASLNVPQVFTKGVTRLIGMGFEVHNTTSQLNVQGTVLGWRQMANDNQLTSWTIIDATAGTATFTGPTVKYPPVNSAEAMLLAGSRQWEAKDGIYAVSAFHTTENPATVISPTCPVILGDAAVDLEGVISTSVVNCPIPGPEDSGARAVPSFRTHNIHQSGAIFTGLSDSTSLTLNWNVFLETFPGSDDQEILPMATPSAEFDPDCLDLYSRVIVDLPVAVPVNENGLGDWFYDAATTAAKYIGPVLSALPHPMLKGAGIALQGLSNVMQADSSKPKRVRKRKAAQPQSQQQTPPNSWGPAVPAARRPRKKALLSQNQNDAVSTQGRPKKRK